MCQTSDPCSSNPCTRGTCQANGANFTCSCPPGYTGTLCEIEIDECESNPCQHGECIDRVNGYSCACQPGWTGTNCDVPPAAPTYNCADRNPCTPENAAAGLFFFAADNPAEFVQCSEFQECFIMPCPPGEVWNQALLTCN